MTKTTVNIHLSVEVPDEHIETLCEMAGFGIHYWAEKATVDMEKRTYTVWLDAEAREDPDMKPKRVLEFDWIAKRLVQLGTTPVTLGVSAGALVARYARQYVAAVLGNEGDADADIDSDLGDIVVQLAYFDGKVVFG